MGHLCLGRNGLVGEPLGREDGLCFGMFQLKESDESRYWRSFLNERGKGLFPLNYRCRCHRQRSIGVGVHEQNRMDLTLDTKVEPEDDF